MLWVVRNRRSDIITFASGFVVAVLWVVRNRRSDIIITKQPEPVARYGLYGIVDLI